MLIAQIQGDYYIFTSVSLHFHFSYNITAQTQQNYIMLGKQSTQKLNLYHERGTKP